MSKSSELLQFVDEIKASTWEHLTEGAEGFTAQGCNDGIQVYSKPVGDLFEMKGVGEIEATPETILGVYFSLAIRSEWDDNFDKGSIIEKLDHFINITKVSSKAPWPISGREMALVNRVEKLDNGGYFAYGRSVDPKVDVPVTSGYVRGTIHRSGVHVEPIDANKCRVTIVMHSDPAGSLPKALVSKGQSRQPQVLAFIRNYIKSHPAKAQAAAEEFIKDRASRQ